MVTLLETALVARANHRCCAFFEIPSSSDCSEAATEPQGYSAPTPIPSRNLPSQSWIGNKESLETLDSPTSAKHGKHTVGTVMSATRRSRESRKQGNNSGSSHLLGEVFVAWTSGVSGIERTIPNLRPILSEIQPKISMPTTVPAKATLVNVLL